jgi:hypothetical protein
MLNELHKRQEDVAHSVDQQVTYFTHLNKDVQFNYMAVSNLSTTLRDFATRTEETFQEVSCKFEWASKQRLVAKAIRDLEFSITQLGVHIDEWLEALQFMSGKVRINLFSPKVLEGIITSVNLGLPEGYELAAGMHPDSLNWYYDTLQTSLLTDAHGSLIVILIPLKDINRHFQLFKAYSFPVHLFNTTYASFQVESEYVAVNSMERSYLP